MKKRFVFGILKVFYYISHLIFIIWVLAGNYRKVTVYIYVTFNHFYLIKKEFGELVMFYETIFLIFFSAYFFFVLLYIARKCGVKFNYNLQFVSWMLFFVYLVFFLMHLELYS